MRSRSDRFLISFSQVTTTCLQYLSTQLIFLFCLFEEQYLWLEQEKFPENQKILDMFRSTNMGPIFNCGPQSFASSKRLNLPKTMLIFLLQTNKFH